MPKQKFDEAMEMLDEVLGTSSVTKELLQVGGEYTPEQFAAAELASERVHLVVRLAALDLKKVGLDCRVDFLIRRKAH